jgi:hypothetical protein
VFTRLQDLSPKPSDENAESIPSAFLCRET